MISEPIELEGELIGTITDNTELFSGTKIYVNESDRMEGEPYFARVRK